MNSPGHQEQQSVAERLRSVHVGVRTELEVSRQILNGKPAYIVRDPITFKTFKLLPDDYQVFVALTADEALGKTFERLCEADRIAPDQEEDFYKYIVHFNQLGLLSLPVSDGKSLYERFVRRRSSERKAKIMGALFLRVPLWHPEAFLCRTIRWFRPFFSYTALLIWFVGVCVCGMVVFSRWQEFCDPLSTMLTLGNLPVLWTLLVGLKVFHEFGHAYACKHYGGKVPEMGAFFIVFTPCAYVDASAAWGFPNRMHRVVVSLAGMYFESIMAMLAILVWAFTGPGVIHSAAQHAVVLSTVVTIGFNANPLMKYDGYFILSDLLGMPNLRNDAQQQLQTQLKRVFYGIKTPSIARSRCGQVMMGLFGLAGALYKVIVVLGISTMVAFKIPALGISLAVFYVGQTLWQMGSKLFHYVAHSEEVLPARRRVIVTTALLVGALVSLIAFAPTPGSVQARGVIKQRDDQVIHADAAGFLVAAEVKDGDIVEPGEVLFRLSNIDIETAAKRKEAELDQLRIQARQEGLVDFRAAILTGDRIAQAKRDLHQFQQDVEDLTVRTSISGVVGKIKTMRHQGQYVDRGKPMATVIAGPWIVKTIVHAETLAETIPEIGDRVTMLPTGHSDRPMVGTITHRAKAGSRIVSEEALTHLGGGDIPVAEDSMEAQQPFFEVTIAIDDGSTRALRHGMTVAIHFPGDRVPVGLYLYRRGLQLLNQLRMAG